MRSLLTLLLFSLVPLVARGEPVRITGETKYKPYTLVRLKAEDVDPKSALLWRINPSKEVQKATSPRGVLEFVAPPGSYDVEVLVISNNGGNLVVEESRVIVTIEGLIPPKPDPKPEPRPDPKPPTDGKLDPINALGRIRFGNAGCTATIIGPRRSDGKWDVLTAAHCMSGEGQRGSLTLKDGRSFAIRVVAHHKTPDVAWCVIEEEVTDLPYALLAEKNPLPDTPIWHMGFGVDKPGNREEGTIAEKENNQGQLRMILSVSSGDSGGGIFRADTNEVVSVVCCTSGMARKQSMWGCATEVARRTRPRPATELDLGWIPLPIPICNEALFDATGDDWIPQPIPIRTSDNPK